jgi:hypothetical protein
MRLTVLLVGLVLAGTTACSGTESSQLAGPAETTASPASATAKAGPASPIAAPGSRSTPRSPAAPLPRLNAAQAVSALTHSGYKCERDSTYAICTSGPVEVWVLTGPQKRPPVVSLHATGSIDSATAAIARSLPRTLELVHVNERAQIADWFDRQAGKAAAQTTVGDWRVELSTEVDTDEPGAHLTLLDKLCTGNCQTE